jgi:TBC1 domain family member 2A
LHQLTIFFPSRNLRISLSIFCPQAVCFNSEENNPLGIKLSKYHKEMFGIQTDREIGSGFTPHRRIRTLWTTPNSSNTTNLTAKVPKKPNNLSNSTAISVKFEDLYGFTVEGNVDDVNVLNEVRERIRQQSKVWCDLEASKGANWYLHTQISSNGVASLKFSVLTNTMTLKKLVRKGVPPTLRPKLWLSLSGAAKKRSTVPETYYDELIRATEGKTTPATRQIDHVSSLLDLHTFLNVVEMCMARLVIFHSCDSSQ